MQALAGGRVITIEISRENRAFEKTDVRMNLSERQHVIRSKLN